MANTKNDDKSKKSRLWGSLAQRGGVLVDRLAGSVKDVARNPLLKQALEAHARGNLPAAFWLLAEASEADDEDIDVCVAFWDVAVEYDHQSAAAPAVKRLIHHYASRGEFELASQYWFELVNFDPAACAQPAALIRMLPLLQEQAEREQDEKKAPMRNEALLRALRAVMDDANEGLTTGVAMRVAEIARELDPETALRAAHHCLGASSLHEVKRAKLIDLILELDPEARIEPPPPDPGPPRAETEIEAQRVPEQVESASGSAETISAGTVTSSARDSSASAPTPATPVPAPEVARNHPLASESPKYEGLSEEEISNIELPPARSPVATPDRRKTRR